MTAVLSSSFDAQLFRPPKERPPLNNFVPTASIDQKAAVRHFGFLAVSLDEHAFVRSCVGCIGITRAQQQNTPTDRVRLDDNEVLQLEVLECTQSAIPPSTSVMPIQVSIIYQQL